MKNLTVLFALVLYYNAAHAQKAVFDISPRYIYSNHSDTIDSLPGYMKGQFWIANGDTFDFTVNQFAYEKHSYLDTLYYRASKNAPIDTLLMQIEPKKSYCLSYNTCCNYFDVQAQPRSGRFQLRIQPKLLNIEKHVKYLIKIDEAGYIYSDTILMESGCRSVLFPNIYSITIMEIVQDTVNTVPCCLFTSDSVAYEPQIRMTKEHIHFRFIPLKSEPYRLIYDIRNERIVKLE